MEALCRLITRTESAAVVAVNGGFGSGKSVFLQMCAAHLRGKGVAAVEFNAWQQSHTREPLVDLVSALAAEATAGQRLLGTMGNLAWRWAQVATKGVVSRKDFQAAEDAPLFEEWKQIEQQRVEFREALAKLVEQHDGRFVVFIDELDRCLPERALELLDTVRHLFDAGGMVTVLGINEHELRQRVRQLFGEGCEAGVYLRRFVDLSIDLPDPGSELAGFLEGSFSGAGLEEHLQDAAYSGHMVKLLAEQPGVSLRDIQQLVHHVSLVLARAPDRGFAHGQQLVKQAAVSLFALRLLARDVYDQFLMGACDGITAAEGLNKKLSVRTTSGRGVVAQRMVMILCHLSLEPLAERTLEHRVSRLRESALFGVVVREENLKVFHDFGMDILSCGVTLEGLSDLVELSV
ncbi:MAG: P-loop NTPase fold protein [Actinomycetia bacterium]|nr:P-loop NTPase fold protein [Actinomycetes bacterium]